MLQRKAIGRFIQWKSAKDKKALLVTGAGRLVKPVQLGNLPEVIITTFLKSIL